MIQPEKFHSATIPDLRLLQGLLGLRGIAAFAVLLFHTSAITKIHIPDGFYFIQHGETGVFLFFVLSAFSLMHSTEHTMCHLNWAREYLTKRFFRIAPLFYTILLYMILRHISDIPSIFIIFINVFFVFGFFSDPEVGLVMGGWTIGVEMIFYILFPVLLMVIRTKKESFILMLVAMLICYFARVELQIEYLNTTPKPKWDPSYFSFISNLYFFTIGIYAYKFKQTLDKENKPLHFFIPAIAVIIIGFLIFTQAASMFKNTARLDLVILGFGFGALCVWQSIKPSFWSANKYFEYLGERSYSIYLLHPLAIIYTKNFIINIYSKLQPSLGEYAFFICALIVTSIVLVMAEVTYRVIEIPSIKLGSKVIKATRLKSIECNN